jgi:hypothetical protein
MFAPVALANRGSRGNVSKSKSRGASFINIPLHKEPGYKFDETDSMLLHLLIIKYVSEQYTEKDEEGKITEVMMDKIIKFMTEPGQKEKELKNYVSYNVINENTYNYKAKKKKGKYDAFNNVFMIETRSDDLKKRRTPDGIYLYKPTYEFELQEFFTIMYLNACKNCTTRYSPDLCFKDMSGFRRRMNFILDKPRDTDFTNDKIKKAIENMTIFENKKEDGKARDIKECNKKNTTDQENYTRIAEELAQIDSSNKESPDQPQIPTEGGRFTKKRKTKNKKTKKHKTKNKKTKRRQTRY